MHTIDKIRRNVFLRICGMSRGFARVGKWLLSRFIRGYVRIRFGSRPLFHDRRGPIERLAWGSFIIAGETHAGGDAPSGAGADIRLIGRAVTAWSERCGHLLNEGMISGISPGEVDVLILGLGIHRAVACPESLLEMIKARGITQVIAVSTPEACKIYNDLFHQGRRVALLAHGTC
jgi:hypothetical protein